MEGTVLVAAVVIDAVAVTEAVPVTLGVELAVAVGVELEVAAVVTELVTVVVTDDDAELQLPEEFESMIIQNALALLMPSLGVKSDRENNGVPIN